MDSWTWSIYLHSTKSTQDDVDALAAQIAGLKTTTVKADSASSASSFDDVSMPPVIIDLTEGSDEEKRPSPKEKKKQKEEQKQKEEPKPKPRWSAVLPTGLFKAKK